MVYLCGTKGRKSELQKDQNGLFISVGTGDVASVQRYAVQPHPLCERSNRYPLPPLFRQIGRTLPHLSAICNDSSAVVLHGFGVVLPVYVRTTTADGENSAAFYRFSSFKVRHGRPLSARPSRHGSLLPIDFTVTLINTCCRRH